ncbi:MAG: endonuclease III [Candidatus Bathyarchaeota archaeon]|nr:endonuclease III [Candidatus Bathyarchaeota archaeon]
MITKPCAQTILQTLKRSLQVPNMVKTNHEPFQTLIITIISQNTADTNTERAYAALQNRFEINPQTLAVAPRAEIEECIRVGGLYQNKAQAIQTASKIILEKFGGSLNQILALPLKEARAVLMAMPGVGPKTADVVLLFSGEKPTIPVDTHVGRVSKRLGLAPIAGDYEAVRLSLQSFFEPSDYLAVHLLLISLGRKYCKSQKPQCKDCPVTSYCPSSTGGPT